MRRLADHLLQESELIQAEDLADIVFAVASCGQADGNIRHSGCILKKVPAAIEVGAEANVIDAGGVDCVVYMVEQSLEGGLGRVDKGGDEGDA